MSKISTGSVLGNYKLDTPIGRGGFGFVFRASSVGHLLGEDNPSADLALKIASPQMDEAAFLQALRRSTDTPRYEAKGLYFMTGSCHCESVDWHEIPDILWDEFSMLRTLRSIKSDLCPRVYDFCATDDVCYYVMEYINGQDFRSVLAGDSLNNSELWIERVRELLVSLSSIKEKSYYFFHGDIKPENIVVDGTDRMRLLDPAMRREVPVGLRMTLTVPYNPFGLTGMEADTFAIATILFEMLLGRHPFAHIARPLISMQRPYHPDEKEELLKLEGLKENLPTSTTKILLDWLIQPRSYKDMLNEWHLLPRSLLFSGKQRDEANGMNEDPPMTLKHIYPSESWINVRHSDDTVSGGVVLDYHPEEDLVLVGFGTGERGLDMKYIRPEDLILSKIDYVEVATFNDQPIMPYEIGTEVFIRRHSGAIEKGVVVDFTPTGKYIKVLSKAKTWKWFPCEILEELQKKA
jgi:serine/threonine protein kinase